jgi:diguanylate cyclase (GGDEF)-like protein/PAS domain S-box-containing protein
MKDPSKTKQELIAELSVLKQRLQELEHPESDRKQAEEKLQKSEERYRTILEDIDEGYFENDLAGIFTFVNDAECRDLGNSREELIGMNYRQYSDEATAKKLYELFYNIYNTGKPIKRFPGQFISKDGTRHFNEVSASLIRDAKGKPIGFRGVSRDITDRKQMEEELRKSEGKYRTIIEQMEEGYFELDLAGNFTFVNDAECRNLGYPKEELIGMNNRQYQDETTAQKMNQLFRRLYRTGEPVKALDVEIIRKTGTKGFNELSVSLIRDAESKPIGFRGISRDITERKRAEEALRESEKRYHELSIVDELTRLFNSRYFYFQLKIELDRSNRYELPLTLLLLDLDNFKVFNDAYGHVEGDQVLRRLGQVVKRCLRQTDSAYRYGGEEFTILMPMTTSKNGAVTAERIRTELKKENFSPAPGQDVHVTVSIGLAQYKPQEDMKAFVHRVDQLMYQVKKNGKDRVCSES